MTAEQAAIGHPGRNSLIGGKFARSDFVKRGSATRMTVPVKADMRKANTGETVSASFAVTVEEADD